MTHAALAEHALVHNGDLGVAVRSTSRPCRSTTKFIGSPVLISVDS